MGGGHGQAEVTVPLGRNLCDDIAAIAQKETGIDGALEEGQTNGRGLSHRRVAFDSVLRGNDSEPENERMMRPIFPRPCARGHGKAQQEQKEKVNMAHARHAPR